MASRAQHEVSNEKVQVDFFLLLLDEIDDLVADELEHGLDDIRSAVADISNCLQASRDELLINELFIRTERKGVKSMVQDSCRIIAA